MLEKRYYYKTKNGEGLFSLKTPDYKNKEGFIEISKEEFEKQKKKNLGY